VAVVTGTRAEFGLLGGVMRAVAAHPGLALRVAVTGTHLLGDEPTRREVEADFAVDAVVPMQTPGPAGRHADAAALGRGITGLAAWLDAASPDVVVVLGDRIEAFAAAAAASVAGIRVAHLHGGDRAEGIADEALRHAITKLAHLHLPATACAADRIVAMGEPAERIRVVGSPAVDGLDGMPPLDADGYDALGRPRIVVLLHPVGRDDGAERRAAEAVLAGCRPHGPVLALDPNHDAGRDGIVAALAAGDAARCAHLPRAAFIGLLRRADLLVGNSSAGLIECAALGRRCVNVGRRQAGRERADNVVDADEESARAVGEAVAGALAAPPPSGAHPFGDGRAGVRTAAALAGFDPDEVPLIKRNTY
jgi:UDP-hydrolysing UDP-N-acetyl-D-glucosamine 2-epimerase